VDEHARTFEGQEVGESEGAELSAEIRQEIRKEIREGIREGIREEIRGEIRGEAREGIRPELGTDMGTSFGTNFGTNFEAVTRVEQSSESGMGAETPGNGTPKSSRTVVGSQETFSDHQAQSATKSTTVSSKVRRKPGRPKKRRAEDADVLERHVEKGPGDGEAVDEMEVDKDTASRTNKRVSETKAIAIKTFARKASDNEGSSLKGLSKPIHKASRPKAVTFQSESPVMGKGQAWSSAPSDPSASGTPSERPRRPYKRKKKRDFAIDDSDSDAYNGPEGPEAGLHGLERSKRPRTNIDYGFRDGIKTDIYGGVDAGLEPEHHKPKRGRPKKKKNDGSLRAVSPGASPGALGALETSPAHLKHLEGSTQRTPASRNKHNQGIAESPRVSPATEQGEHICRTEVIFYRPSIAVDRAMILNMDELWGRALEATRVGDPVIRSHGKPYLRRNVRLMKDVLDAWHSYPESD
jgi:hypothetical protein